MAERQVPARTRRYPTLNVDNGNIQQQAYNNANIRAVNFGPKSRTNTIPGAQAEAFDAGHKVAPYLGRQFETMQANTMALLEHAKNSGKLQEWSQFYPHAHEFAADLTRKFPGLSHLQASGIVASLSGGGGEWEVNKANANRVMDAHKSGTPLSFSDLHGVEGSRLDNARQILGGADPREVLGNMKERNFMENIHNPEGDNLTMDTHMHHGMTGWKRPWRGAGGGAPGLQDPRVYNFMANAVRSAAQEHGLTPTEGQSAAWYANKDLMGGVSGTVPPHHDRFSEYYDPAQITPGKRYRA